MVEPGEFDGRRQAGFVGQLSRDDPVRQMIGDLLLQRRGGVGFEGDHFSILLIRLFRRGTECRLVYDYFIEYNNSIPKTEANVNTRLENFAKKAAARFSGSPGNGTFGSERQERGRYTPAGCPGDKNLSGRPRIFAGAAFPEVRFCAESRHRETAGGKGSRPNRSTGPVPSRAGIAYMTIRRQMRQLICRPLRAGRCAERCRTPF